MNARENKSTQKGIILYSHRCLQKAREALTKEITGERQFIYQSESEAHIAVFDFFANNLNSLSGKLTKKIEPLLVEIIEHSLLQALYPNQSIGSDKARRYKVTVVNWLDSLIELSESVAETINKFSLTILLKEELVKLRIANPGPILNEICDSLKKVFLLKINNVSQYLEQILAELNFIIDVEADNRIDKKTYYRKRRLLNPGKNRSHDSEQDAEENKITFFQHKKLLSLLNPSQPDNEHTVEGEIKVTYFAQ